MSLAHVTRGPEFEKLHHRLAVSLILSDLDAGDMAERLGVHRNTITNYTSGRSVPTDTRLRLWAWHTAHVGCDYEWLKHETTSAPDPDGPRADTGTPPGTRTQNLRIMGTVSRIHPVQPAA